jgi:adenine-specific DNA-methyltransferase
MGSKRWMLANGLGHLLRDEIAHAKRFVDLFAGSGAVSQFVAVKSPLPVLAFDLQEFSAVLTRAVVSRTNPVDADSIWKDWSERAFDWASQQAFRGLNVSAPNGLRDFTRSFIEEVRDRCESWTNLPILRAYGGHYFSSQQALSIEALRRTLPSGDAEQVALAALVQASSQCVAAPGHTAQPFQPTQTAKRFLHEAWKRDVVQKTELTLKSIATKYAQAKGSAEVADANIAVNSTAKGDLVFIDPPYSGVHYSRFYHVLETIARGTCGEVDGVGRYPPSTERPRSKYSVSSESREAIEELLTKIAENGATAIITFPDKKCSNGISSYWIEKIARREFRTLERKVVRGRFSTLGGDGQHRDARQASAELVLVLRP